MGVTNKVLCILLAQGDAKLPEVKVGDTNTIQELEPRQHSSGADRVGLAKFFQALNSHIWHFCSLLSYKGAVPYLKVMILEEMDLP